MWSRSYTRKGRRYSHVGVVIFGRDHQQPDRTICKFAVPALEPVLKAATEHRYGVGP